MLNYAELLNEANGTILQLKNAMHLDNWPLYEGLHLTANDGIILEALLETRGACLKSKLLDRRGIGFSMSAENKAKLLALKQSAFTS